MRTITVVVPWEEGLHLRPAARLVKLAKSVHSTVSLKAGGKVADARSILSILLLAASLGAVVQIDICGVDEVQAQEAIVEIFEDVLDENA